MENIKDIRTKDIRYFIKAIVGLAFIFGFQFLPAPAPITPVGMAMFGAFLGIIFLVSTGDTMWPSFAVICAVSFHIHELYPATKGAGIFEAVKQSFGHWITLFIVSLLFVCYALEKTGTLRRIMLWFITRKVAQKGPWTFTFMLLLSAFILSAFMDATPTIVIMIMSSHEIFKALGFKEGDSWPCMVIACIPMIAAIGFGMTPIGHNQPIGILGVVSGISGDPINILSYMLVGVPVGSLIFLSMFFYFKYIVKPDVSLFDNVTWLLP